MQRYFQDLQAELDRSIEIASDARKKGFDPSLEVEIPVAEDLASRVEKLVGPPGVAEEIRAKAHLGNRELIAIIVSKEIAKKMTDKTKEEALDQAIRTGLAILTEGVLVAPLEGIADVKLGRNADGTDYADVYFAGPIRSAGGTGQALSVLIADVVREALGVGKYQPTVKEVERYKEEFGIYRNLQYKPTNEEVQLIVESCAVCVNGEGTERDEVTGNRDLPRVPTNQVRGGICLVIAEGLCLKAAKIDKHVKKLDIQGWSFIEKFLKKEKKKEEESTTCQDLPSCLEGFCEPPPGAVDPKTKYIKDLIAGRPVFGHPSKPGNFRLRYGRGRTTGLAATAISPAAMYLVDEFLAIGTQIKMERPGKAGAITPCDSIEGPLVLLNNKSLIQVNDEKMAKDLKGQVKEIIDLGEVLIPFGEFAENNHVLIPGTYSKEWWYQDYQKAGGKKLEDFYPSPREAVELSRELNIPLCPDYNLFWHDLSIQDIEDLAMHISGEGKYTDDLGMDETIALPKDFVPFPVTHEISFPKRSFNQELSIPSTPEIKDILTVLGVEHFEKSGTIHINKFAYPLIICLGLDTDLKRIRTTEGFNAEIHRDDRPQVPREQHQVLKLVEMLAGIKVNARSPVRIGTRMGRPEKADLRKMKPPVHGLFPIGHYGTNQRLLRKAAVNNIIEVEVGPRWCSKCSEQAYMPKCERCGTHTQPPNKDVKTVNWKMPLPEIISKAKMSLGLDSIPEVKAVQGLISKSKVPEMLEKGMLRARHDVFVFKDGTSRFDLTDLSLSHFRPKEISLSVEKAKELGYVKDIFGEPLTDPNQICELKVQDVVSSNACGEYFIRVAAFIDDLLVRMYGLEPFYNVKTKEDLIGHLTIGLAPHTSGGVLCRMIGFVDAAVGYGHPFFHAAKRRNCLPGETEVLMGNGKFEKLEELYEQIPGVEKTIDAVGTIEKESHKHMVISIDPETGNTTEQRIKKVLKVPSPDNLIEIQTNAGRIFRASPYHPLALIDSKNGLFKKKALEAEIGDHLYSFEELEEVYSQEAFMKKNYDKIVSIQPVPSNENYIYDIEVENTHNFITKELLLASNCDGDEDALMLLLDGLLNFSRSFIPEKRGGLMDAPLVLSMKIDPNEIDKEAQNVDCLMQYPLEYYQATQTYCGPKDYEKLMDTISGRIGTPKQYEDIYFTHDTKNIAAGPTVCAYKSPALKTMMDKMNAQLSLGAKLRSVDVADVAAKVIGTHFLPDMIGNLKSFSRQELRCTKCGKKYRRIPLAGKCTNPVKSIQGEKPCGNKLTMTVSEGSVKKYLNVTKDISKEYNISQYMQQRVLMTEIAINSLFESDKVKKMKLTDFL